MSVLHTYTGRQVTEITSTNPGVFVKQLVPGSWVKRCWQGSSFGTNCGLGLLVATGKRLNNLSTEEDFVTVLWTVEPCNPFAATQPVFAPYIPLQVTPTFQEHFVSKKKRKMSIE